ncbi:tetratricopeptide repeat protein [Parapedobacter sp. 2B3]|uniref:tetratricopeptide repeat-containing sensor histidine kinase n=1 Tax=Parapedobacter sp. 2B3 TaxID=3342381 RepID=UPI0035B5A7AE
MAKFLASCILFVIAANVTAAQTLAEDIAALKASLPEKKGGDKVMLYKDIGMKFRSVNVDSAMYYTDMAFREAEAMDSDYYRARIWMTYGILSWDAGKPKEALNYHLRAKPILETSKEHYVLGSLYTNLANAYESLAEFDTAVKYQFKALENFIAGKDSVWIAGAYLNLGNRYKIIQETDLSLEYYLKALDIYKKIRNDYYVAMSYNSVAAAYLQKKQFDKTFEFAKKSADGYEAIGARLEKAYPLTNMALSSWGMGKLAEAEKYLIQSMAIQEERGERLAILFLKNDLANIHLAQGKVSKAETLALAILAEAEQMNFVPGIETFSKTLSQIYEKMPNYKKALAYLKKHIDGKDSLYFSEKAREMLNLREKYEAAEKENLILQQRAKIADHQLTLKNRGLWIFGLLALAIIIGLIGFLLYKQQVLKNIRQQKDNEMQLALEKIETQNRLKEQQLSISRDLHDNIGAHLTFIISAIDTAKQLVGHREPKLFERLGDMGSFAKDTIRELRDTIWAMNRPAISIEDLKSRIANFIEGANQTTMNVSLSFVDEVKDEKDLLFNSKAGMNVYRILQEAVNNALKHADATRIDISFARQSDLLQIRIDDNGKGFDTLETQDGNGLQNMKNRAGALGGTLHISTENGLTRVECRFPIQSNEPS